MKKLAYTAIHYVLVFTVIFEYLPYLVFDEIKVNFD